ncbi:magnesium chelatase subunit H [Rhodovibrio salinarum]|uniref:magnesium chelatase n=1 Tax=Rhodovibrio salinarum TaxID=1087 RepID=A0A934QG24_9PROT|nr:magnesium chelatase subunit H [Rhodovibrio salinarum]MBK1696331.1 magnesium chelatase subunit H [Rhodovibrio salinarum]
MPKRTSAHNSTPLRVVIVTLDTHLASATEQACRQLQQRELPGLELNLHAATEWNRDPDALERCREDIAQGDIVIASMLFMEDHIQAVLPDLQARRDTCDAMICAMSAGEVIKLTRIGQFDMSGEQSAPIKLLKRLKGSKKPGSGSSGSKQMAMLRRVPKMLRYIPGTAQDVRAYFLTLQYMLAGSTENVANMVRFLVNRYAAGTRAPLAGTLAAPAPREYPDVGVYHPRMKDRIASDAGHLPRLSGAKARVGVLLMRSYVLANNAQHYDGVIQALEARGLEVVPAFASGLDNRPAVETFFMKDGQPTVDAVVSLTGFSLVGGPAYNDAGAAEAMLEQLDVPYIAAHAVEFQTMEAWKASENGLMPVEATMMVAIPELDGATGSMVFGGRSINADDGQLRDMHVHPERANMLARRVDKQVQLRKSARKDRKLAIALFNFPPNAGATGTAAFLSVFESLHRTLGELKQAGYTVDVPETVDELRAAIVQGNAEQFGALANVHHRTPVDQHVKRETWLKDIEAAWGPAPGRQNADGRHLFVMGAQFGNVFVGVQPGFGYEGDPMRLLFEKGFAPTHDFSNFYRYIKEDFGAHAVLHFGTHGALEFMPGKQTGLSNDCWPDRLIGDLPNFYLYAANNPSEGMLAKRRGAATLISYMTPPLARAGLYKDLLDLKHSIERYRALPPQQQDERDQLTELIQAQAIKLDLADEDAATWTGATAEENIYQLHEDVRELENTLIPYGLHTLGEAPTPAQRVEMLTAMVESDAEADGKTSLPYATIEALVEGQSPEQALQAGGRKRDASALDRARELQGIDRQLKTQTETQAILHALDGGFIPPAPGGDFLRKPSVLPTGRNIHGFDPFRLPSAFAMHEGRRQSDQLIERYRADGNGYPESIALVLWGTDNLKNEGAPIAQALSLMGAEPRFDSYGRLAGAKLSDLDTLGRPRIDVVMTLSGIFRDLLPMQTKLLAEAAYLAAQADEAPEWNFVRKHALAYMQQEGVDLETAALRVFSNAEGAYGSNVNQLVENGRWNDEDELADAYTKRKCFAYGVSGSPMKRPALLNRMLGDVQMAYQNLDSTEVGVTSIGYYFDTLGSISRAAGKAQRENGQAAAGNAGKNGEIPVYVGDHTTGKGKVRTIGEQVGLETRTRSLNPKWYEGMLESGYEGVRQIEQQITNTMGWSATTGQVQPWVYDRLTQTFVLDDEMRERLAQLNPAASARMANRLIEAHERNYWTPDDATLEALRRFGEELEDRLEGIDEAAA